MQAPFRFVLGILAFSSVYSFSAVYEAEDQEIPTTAQVLDSADLSGGKYVSASSDFSFVVNAEETALHNITIESFVDNYTWSNFNVSVNGNLQSTFLMKDTSHTSACSYTLSLSAKLIEGENTITISGGAAFYDFLSLERKAPPQFTLDNNPVSQGFTVEAKKLKSFLHDNFSKRTVAGMMIGDNAFNYNYAEMKLIETCVPEDSCSFADSLTTFLGQEDIRLFKEKSGYYPALGGFDMLFATGGHSDEGWFLGYTENNIRMAIELWEKGGIPAFTWHWKVGQDTVFYTKSGGQASDSTKFDYSKAFKDTINFEWDTESEEYQLLIADIDKISAWFLKLQEAGVAALWRPLHEAAGGWFWWGINGPKAYQALYKLVFERMVLENKIKNLIWIWNIERDPKIGYDAQALNKEWYPGDAYVDIIGVDIYNTANDHSSNMIHYNKIVDEMGTKKILALTENGPIPDVDSMHVDESVWSFWMPWYNTWSSNFLTQTSDAVWQKNLSDDRIIKLETMPGWDNYSVKIFKKVANPSTQIHLNGKSLVINSPEALSLQIFNLKGQEVQKKLLKSNISQNQKISLEKLPQGFYLLKLKGKNFHYSKTFQLF